MTVLQMIAALQAIFRDEGDVEVKIDVDGYAHDVVKVAKGTKAILKLKESTK